MDWLPKGKEIVETFDVNPAGVGKTRVIRSNIVDDTDTPLPPVKRSTGKKT